MDLKKVKDEARQEASLYKTAQYFIRQVKGRKDCVVTHIQEYDYDYRIYFDIATEEEIDNNLNTYEHEEHCGDA